MTVVNAPIAYELTYTPARSSKERTIVVRDTAPVAIPDASGAEAPVAVRARLGDGRSIEYRYHGGQLWEPSGDPVAAAAAKEAKDFQGNPLVAKGSPLLGKTEVPTMESIVINPKKPVSSNRDRAEAILQNAADGMLMVEGRPMIPSIGPVIALRVAKGAREGTLVLVDQADRSADLADSMLFRADQRALAEETCKGLFKRMPPVEFEAVEILMPEALATDMTDYCLVRTAERMFLRDVDAIGIGNLPTDFLELYLDYTEPEFDTRSASPELVDMVAKASTMLQDVRDCGPVARIGRWMAIRIEGGRHALEGTRLLA